MRKKSISARLRSKIASRANHLCEYCKCPRAYSPSPFDVEHIIPVSQSGDSTLENLAFSCHGCNTHKYNKVQAVDPVDQTLVELFHPRKDKWSDHFAWDEEGLYIIGTTVTGRATVEALQLNRVSLVNLRTLLQLVGEHPPPE